MQLKMLVSVLNQELNTIEPFKLGHGSKYNYYVVCMRNKDVQCNTKESH